MKNKKKMIIPLVSLATILVIIGIVIAFLIASEKRDNTVYIGEGDAEIVEEFEAPKKLEQSNEFKKQISVKNTGKNDCYVRVFVDFSSSEIRNKSYLSNEDDPNDSTKGTNFKSVTEFIESLKESDSNTTNWVYIPENDANNPKLGGYFYYTKPLSAGESTNSLFKWVRTVFGENEDPQAFDIIVYTETVQTVETNNGTVYSDSGSWKAAWNNFLT